MKAAPKQFRKRNAILSCLRGTDSHPSAEWIYDQLKSEYPEISLATVYRNLALFKEQGLIASLGTVGGVERFDGNTEPHVHFICSSCSRIEDLPEVQAPEDLCAEAEDATGGKVTGCILTFTGVCAQCREDSQENCPEVPDNENLEV